MLLSFQDLIKKYSIDSKGILHIGSNDGAECREYYANGIERTIWVEAIPAIYQQLLKNIEPYFDAIAFNECISDVDGKEVKFNISSNHGESSSFLEFGTHKDVHPDVSFVGSITCKTKRIDTLFRENDLDIKDYTFLNIDLQGAELLALKGMGNLLQEVKYIYTEVNKAELYIGCCLIEQLDEHLATFGFKRVETEWAGNTNWGDSLYVKL
jgi:FkbM family methyltransferase